MNDEIGEWREPGIELACDVKRLRIAAAAKGDPQAEVKLFHIDYDDGSSHNALVAVAADGRTLAAMRVL